MTQIYFPYIWFWLETLKISQVLRVPFVVLKR